MSGATIKIQVIGLRQVKARLTLAQKNIPYSMKTATQEAGQVYLAAIKSYPASNYTEDWKNRIATFYPIKPPKNKYKRTKSLQNSWNGRIEAKAKSGNVKYIIYQKQVVNKKSKKGAKEYMHYVMGRQQTFQHKGYWKTYDDWEKEVLPHINQVYSQYLGSKRFFVTVK